MDNIMDMDSNQGILSSTLYQSNFQNKEKGISIILSDQYSFPCPVLSNTNLEQEAEENQVTRRKLATRKRLIVVMGGDDYS